MEISLIPANILNKHSGTVDRKWSSSLGGWAWELVTPYNERLACYEVRFVSFPATEYNEVLSRYQPVQMVER